MPNITINNQTFNVINYGAENFHALCQAERVLEQLQNAYPSDTVLMSPNDGEIISIEELARVRGILSFLTCNRVVEVNP